MLNNWKKNLMIGAAALTVAGGVAVASMNAQVVNAASASVGLMGRDAHRGGFGQRGPGRGNHEQELADALGVTVEELQAAHESVRTQLRAEDSSSGHGRFGHDRGAAEQALADALGIEVAELEAAVQSVRETALAEALANGDITQEQADRMEAAAAVHDYVDHRELLAGVLSMTVEQLDAALEDGVRMGDLVEEQGFDRETLSDALHTAYQNALTEAVADGVITLEQAELLQDGEGHGFGRGFGGQRGFDHGRNSVGTGEGRNFGPRQNDSAPDRGTSDGFSAPAGGQL